MSNLTFVPDTVANKFHPATPAAAPATSPSRALSAPVRSRAKANVTDLSHRAGEPSSSKAAGATSSAGHGAATTPTSTNSNAQTHNSDRSGSGGKGGNQVRKSTGADDAQIGPTAQSQVVTTSLRRRTDGDAYDGANDGDTDHDGSSRTRGPLGDAGHHSDGQGQSEQADGLIIKPSHRALYTHADERGTDGGHARTSTAPERLLQESRAHQNDAEPPLVPPDQSHRRQGGPVPEQPSQPRSPAAVAAAAAAAHIKRGRADVGDGLLSSDDGDSGGGIVERAAARSTRSRLLTSPADAEQATDGPPTLPGTCTGAKSGRISTRTSLELVAAASDAPSMASSSTGTAPRGGAGSQSRDKRRLDAADASGDLSQLASGISLMSTADGTEREGIRRTAAGPPIALPFKGGSDDRNPTASAHASVASSSSAAANAAIGGFAGSRRRSRSRQHAGARPVATATAAGERAPVVGGDGNEDDDDDDSGADAREHGRVGRARMEHADAEPHGIVQAGTEAGVGAALMGAASGRADGKQSSQPGSSSRSDGDGDDDHDQDQDHDGDSHRASPSPEERAAAARIGEIASPRSASRAAAADSALMQRRLEQHARRSDLEARAQEEDDDEYDGGHTHHRHRGRVQAAVDGDGGSRANDEPSAAGAASSTGRSVRPRMGYGGTAPSPRREQPGHQRQRVSVGRYREIEEEADHYERDVGMARRHPSTAASAALTAFNPQQQQQHAAAYSYEVEAGRDLDAETAEETIAAVYKHMQDKAVKEAQSMLARLGIKVQFQRPATDPTPVPLVAASSSPGARGTGAGGAPTMHIGRRRDNDEPTSSASARGVVDGHGALGGDDGGDHGHHGDGHSTAHSVVAAVLSGQSPLQTTDDVAEAAAATSSQSQILVAPQQQPLRIVDAGSAAGGAIVGSPPAAVMIVQGQQMQPYPLIPQAQQYVPQYQQQYQMPQQQLINYASQAGYATTPGMQQQPAVQQVWGNSAQQYQPYPQQQQQQATGYPAAAYGGVPLAPSQADGYQQATHAQQQQHYAVNAEQGAAATASTAAAFAAARQLQSLHQMQAMMAASHMMARQQMQQAATQVSASAEADAGAAGISSIVAPATEDPVQSGASGSIGATSGTVGAAGGRGRRDSMTSSAAACASASAGGGIAASTNTNRPARSGPPGPVILINGFNPSSIGCDEIRAICSVYGAVLRVKILIKKPDTALVEFAAVEQAEVAVRCLSGAPLRGRTLKVERSSIKSVQMPKPEDTPPAASDGRPLTKSYETALEQAPSSSSLLIAAAWGTSPPSEVLLFRVVDPARIHAAGGDGGGGSSASASDADPKLSAERLTSAIGPHGRIVSITDVAPDGKSGRVRMASIEDAVNAVVGGNMSTLVEDRGAHDAAASSQPTRHLLRLLFDSGSSRGTGDA